jgi:hypothetical protein
VESLLTDSGRDESVEENAITASPSTAPSGLPSDFPSRTPSAAPSSVPSDLPSQVPSDAPSYVPSDLPSALPSDTPSQTPSDVPSLLPEPLVDVIPTPLAADVLVDASDAPSSVPSSGSSPVDDKDIVLPSDFPSISPSGTKLVDGLFLDAKHIEIFEEVCANAFLKEYLPWVQSADYRSVTCSVVSQKESSLRRQLQTTEHKAEVTYRTNGIDLLVLVFGIVDLPQDVSFQSVVYQTFFTFKAEFQQDLSSVSDFFEKPDTSGQSAATEPESTTNTSSGKSFFGGAGKGLYVGAAALIVGGLLALSISFFVLRRREDDTSTRETPRHAKEDASANHLSIRVQSEDEMLPLSPIGLGAIRPPPLDMEPGVEEAVEGDDGDSSESKSEPMLNQYSPRGPTNQPVIPRQSPRVSAPAEGEDSGCPMGTTRGDVESQDASSSEEDMGWRRLLSFGKRKRSIDKPPLQQQRDIGISPNQSTVESVLADWTQGSLGTEKGHEHVLTDLDKLAKKKSAASTPKYDNTSAKSPQW